MTGTSVLVDRLSGGGGIRFMAVSADASCFDDDAKRSGATGGSASLAGTMSPDLVISIGCLLAASWFISSGVAPLPASSADEPSELVPSVFEPSAAGVGCDGKRNASGNAFLYCSASMSAYLLGLDDMRVAESNAFSLAYFST